MKAANAQSLSGGQSETDALGDAIRWLSDVMTGTVGSAAAVLAVAGLAIVMLQGRLPVRRGAATMLGCFILFASPAIAAGLLGAIGHDTYGGAQPPIEASPAYAPPSPQPVPYDPYAGASVPARPQDGARDLLPQ